MPDLGTDLDLVSLTTLVTLSASCDTRDWWLRAEGWGDFSRRGESLSRSDLTRACNLLRSDLVMAALGRRPAFVRLAAAFFCCFVDAEAPVAERPVRVLGTLLRIGLLLDRF